MATFTKGTGVLLLQLGTPDAPTPAALRTYLREFLSDPRVIDLPRAVWLPILYGAVLPRRPAKSAALYKKVWMAEGSPLLVISQAQAKLLSTALDGQPPVEVAMRYGNPSIEAAVDRLMAAGCDRLIAVPMFPQYASATTGSAVERLFEVIGRRRVVPPVQVLSPYFEAPEYIDALAAVTRESLADWVPDHIVLSYHGLPKRYADEGDPYPKHCHATSAALIKAMGWPVDRVTVAFQSRFGREEWLRPYADETLRELAAKKIPRLAILCPAFTADCLETLEEIGMTNQELYHAAGGGEYRALPCINTHPKWIEGLASLIRQM